MKRNQVDNTVSLPYIHINKPSLTPLPPHPDIAEMSLPSTMRTDFPDEDDILNFFLYIEPDEGMYKGGIFKFKFAVPETFPHEPPKVNCEQKIYHPNIDVEGKICLNILREDWKPVLNLQAIVIGLQVRELYSLFLAFGGGGAGGRLGYLRGQGNGEISGDRVCICVCACDRTDCG